MAAIAAREGRPAQEVVYDFLTEGDGRNLVMFPFTNYFHFSLDDVHDMLEHPASVLGSRRRRRALRRGGRFQRADAHAHALGARPRRAARVSTSRPRCDG